MTVAATYDSVLSRVRISATSLPVAADAVRVERSTDGIRWTTVRGGSAVPVVASSATCDDYEFAADVLNTYRVSAVDTNTHSNVGVGTSAVSPNAAGVSTLSPGLPVGWLPADLHLLLASIRNSGVGTVDTPAGWTPLVTSGNFALFGRRAQTGDTAPTVTFTGGVANASILAQIYGRRNAELLPVVSTSQLNASGQDIPYPALNVEVNGCLVIVAGWKQDDVTTVDTIPLGTENAEINETGGDDASMVWDRIVQTTAATVAAGSFVVTGGAAAISRSIVAAFRQADYIQQETTTITPTLGGVWLKSISRPFLNRAVSVRGFSDITRPSRAGVFDVIGRSFPVSVTDVRGSQRWTLELVTDTAQEASDLDLILASGDNLFLHVTTNATDLESTTPNGYVVVGDAVQRMPGAHLSMRVWSLPCTEVAPPGPDIVGATVEWQSIINNYPTWADVIAAFPAWSDLMDFVASPSDVLVP